MSKINYKGPNYLRRFIGEIKKMNVYGLNIDFYVPQINEDDSLLLEDYQYKEIGEILIEEIQKRYLNIFTTKKVIEYQMGIRRFPKKCAVSDNNYFISNKDTLKKCASNNNDCSRCRVFERYTIPSYMIIDWIKLKIVMWKYLFGE